MTFEEGQSTWEIRQGFFEPQALGTITVAAQDHPGVSGAVESSSYRWPGAARALVPLAAIALATVAIAGRDHQPPPQAERGAMTTPGIVAAVGAMALGVASIIGWGSTSPEPSPKRSSEPAAASADLDGAALFQAKGCSSCHDGPDTRSLVDGFPNLSDVASFAGSRKPGYTAEEYVAESIREPGEFLSPAFQGGVGPASFMPTLDVSDAEVDALVAYLLRS